MEQRRGAPFPSLPLLFPFPSLPCVLSGTELSLLLTPCSGPGPGTA